MLKTMNLTFTYAVKNNEALLIKYDGKRRKILPIAHGISHIDNEVIRAVEWYKEDNTKKEITNTVKQFEVSKIETVLRLNENYTYYRKGVKVQDKGFKTVYQDSTQFYNLESEITEKDNHPVIIFEQLWK